MRSQHSAFASNHVKLDFGATVYRVVYSSKQRWLRNRRRSYRLWSAAYSQLSADLKSYLSFTADELKDPPTQALRLVNKSIDSEKSRSWKIKRNSGEQVPLRTILSSIICWIDRFKQVGDTLVQYDPVHSALPWAAVRFCLDVALSDMQNYNAYIDGLEQVSKLIAEYAEYQNTLLAGRSNLKKQLEAAVITLYVAVLTYLAEVRRYLESSTRRRLARNIGHGSTPKAAELLAAIDKHQAYSQRLVAALQHEINYRKLSDIERSIQGVETLMRRPVLPLSEKRSILLRLLGACFTNDTLDAALARCQSGTASWIFDRPTYQKWLDVSDPISKLLWIYGPPGTGKTVLSANLIRSLQSNSSRTTTYFFCVHEDKTRRDANAVIRSCLAQLIEQVDLAAFIAHQIIGSKVHRPLTDTDIWTCFGEICKEVPNCTLVIDGFDECLGDAATSRLFEDNAKSSFLRKLMIELTKTPAYVLLVSRDDADIRTELSGSASTSLVMSQYSIQKADQEQDLQTITQTLINERLSDRPQSVRDEIAQNAIDKSDGMMLWVRLLAKELRPKANAKALRRIVSEMPAGIEQAYERDLARLSLLSGDDKAQATYILRWLLFSSRPMTVGEVVEALIMVNAEDGDEYPADELPDAWGEGKISEDFVNDLFRRMLGSLIDIRSNNEDESVLSHTLHFVHFSVKEYLLKSTANGLAHSVLKLATSNEEHTKLASICLRYLCFDVFGGPTVADEAAKEKTTSQEYPFSLYAAQNWFWHSTREGPMSQELVPLIETLLDPKMSNWFMWSRIFETTIQVHTSFPDLEVDDREKLRRVPIEGDDRVWFTFDRLVKLGQIEDFDEVPKVKETREEGYEYNTTTPRPMYYAGLLGVVNLVKNMWSHGYQLHEEPGRLGNLLHAAAYQGHTQIVAYLIEQGIDIQQTGGPFTYAIIAAAAAGCETTLQLLLSHGADANCQNCKGDAAIHYAAAFASLNVLRALVQHGANPSLVNKDGISALHLAAKSGQVDAVRILLEAGADIGAFAPKDFFTNTALHMAISEGFRDIVSLLLEKGADIHQVSYVGSTCLHLAFMSEDSSMIEMMLAKDLSTNQKDFSGITALHHAVMAGNKDLFRKLVENGAEINAAALDGTTPLYLAYCMSETSLVEALLERNANVNLAPKDGFSLLVLAVINEDYHMVQLLIDNGVEVNKLYMDTSPLGFAVRDGLEDIAKALIEGGADINYREPVTPDIPFPQTILDLACLSDGGSAALARMLLAHGAGANEVSPQNPYTRALSLTNAEMVNVELIQLLLDHGADAFAVEPELTWSIIDSVVRFQAQRAMRFIIPHDSVWPKLLPTLSHDARSAILLLDTLLTDDIEVFRAALSSVRVSGTADLMSQLLIVAVMSNSSDAVDYLLDQGASVSDKDHTGRTVAHYAALRGDDELMKRLLDRGAVPDTLDGESQSPLQYALAPGVSAATVVELLLRKDIEMRTDTKTDCTPDLIRYWRDNVHCLRGGMNWDGTINQVAPFEINPWSDTWDDDILNKSPRFTGFRNEEALTLKVFGYLHGDDCVTWYHLAVNTGSVQRGKIDFNGKKIVTTFEVYGVAQPRSITLYFETRTERDERLDREKKEKEKGLADQKVVVLAEKK